MNIVFEGAVALLATSLWMPVYRPRVLQMPHQPHSPRFEEPASLSHRGIDVAASARRVAIVNSEPRLARALEAILTDEAVVLERVGPRLDALATVDAEAVVCFVEGFDLDVLLPRLNQLYLRRPSVALVIVADQTARWALWRAFERSTLAPTVLRDTSPALVIRDAIRLACDAYVVDSASAELGLATHSELIERAVAEAVRTLRVEATPRDQRFDRFLPARWRAASNQFWTPLEVVKRAVSWLDELGVETVVDIGSGVGKFCIAGALSSRSSFIGIEHRPELAAVARSLAATFGVEPQVSILEACFDPAQTPAADCYYLFNPFEENLLPPDEVLDASVDLNALRFLHELRSFRTLVAALPLGAYVLTYNGIGGRLPASLVEVRVDRELPAVLRLLQKVQC